MRHLGVLLRKELKLLRNTYFRTGKRGAITIGLSLLVLLLPTLLVIWFRLVAFNIPSVVVGGMVRPLVLVISLWFTIIMFFSTINHSKTRFFLTPDLALLAATPVSPLTLFALRFVLLVCFNSGTFLQLSMFGFAPLIALGAIFAAPWYYYALVPLVTYMYVVIPAALGVTLLMLLTRALSPKRLFQVMAVLGTGVELLWLAFIVGGSDQEALLSRLIVGVEGASPLIDVLLPLRALGDLWPAVLGLGGSVGRPLIVLVSCAAAAFGLAMAVMSRYYYQNYERLQTAEVIGPKRVVNSAKRRADTSSKRSTHHLIAATQWKMALRNREMAQGGLGVFMMLLAYVVFMGDRVSGGGPLVMISNIAVIGFFATIGVQVLFLPFAMMQDRSVLVQQYWPFRSAPISEHDAAWAFFLANLPALLISWVVLVVANYFTGVSGPLMLLSLVLMFFVIASLAAVNQISSLLSVGTHGERIPLLTRLLRDLVPLLYIPLALLPMLLGSYYRSLGFLSFLHALPPGHVLAGAALLSALIMALIWWAAMSQTKKLWANLEIR